MESTEQTGRNVDEAVAAALKVLGVTRDQVKVEILAQESRGVLGIFGHTQAKVRVTLLPPAEQPPAPSAQPATAAPPRAEPEAPSQTPAPRPALAGPPSALAQRARDLLAEVLERMGIQGAPEVISEDPEGIYLNIRTTTDMGLIIGRRGQTLAALQLLVAMMANRPLPQEDRKRIILDVEDYRDRRERSLQAMARNAAERARRSGRPVTIGELTPRERRIIHLALADDSSVSTRSEGEDPDRVIIISPRDAPRRSSGPPRGRR
jgi:spoIIIJ-associated protein